MFTFTLALSIYISLCETPPWYFGLLQCSPEHLMGHTRFGWQVSAKYGTWYGVRVILKSICAGILCGHHLEFCYTVLTRPNQVETAVHGCNPTLSVSVMLVSPKVNFFTESNRPCSLLYVCSFFGWLGLLQILRIPYEFKRHYRSWSFAFTLLLFVPAHQY